MKWFRAILSKWVHLERWSRALWVPRRYGCFMPVELGLQRKRGWAYIVVLSETGCFFYSKEELRPYEEADLRGMIRARVRIVRELYESELLLKGYGCKFLDMNHEDRASLKRILQTLQKPKGARPKMDLTQVRDRIRELQSTHARSQ